jgi:hypothetical protein
MMLGRPRLILTGTIMFAFIYLSYREKLSTYRRLTQCNTKHARSIKKMVWGKVVTPASHYILPSIKI